MKRDLELMELLVLQKNKPIVEKIILVTELYLYSLTLGLIMINHHTLSVHMIMQEEMPISVQMLILITIMLMAIGSMYILVSQTKNINLTLHSLVTLYTKQLLQ